MIARYKTEPTAKPSRPPRGGIATRLALFLSAGLFLALVLGTIGFVADRGRDSLALFGFNLTNRVTAIVRLVESLPPDQAIQVLQAANSPTLRVLPLPAHMDADRILPRWTARPRFIDREALARRVRDRLPGLNERDIQIRLIDSEGAERLTEIGGRLAAPDLLESQRKIAILVPLLIPIGTLDGPALPGAVAPGMPSEPPETDSPVAGRPNHGAIPLVPGGPLSLPQGPRTDRVAGQRTDHGERGGRDDETAPSSRSLTRSPPQALIFVASYQSPSLEWLARTAGFMLLAGGALVIFTLWAARRATRPIRAFAQAADRLGIDVDAPRLPETGSRELRNAARAFNTMADRLGRLIADRAQMVAAISHDLRTMLTRLRLRAELIDDPVQREKAFGDLDTMTEMVNASLAFARDDAKREARAPLDLARLLQSLVDDQTDAGAEARYDGPESLVIQGQPTGLRRVFENLIGNALGYAGAAKVILSSPDTSGTERSPGQVMVTVIDHGPGIPPDRYEDVFAPFVRLEDSRNRDTGGAGLGLAVARSILRAHGGDITLKETEGGGLTVLVILPR